MGNDRVELSVYCTDGTFTSGPMVMEVVITNQRQKPIFTNIPATVSIPETTTTNTDVIFVSMLLKCYGSFIITQRSDIVVLRMLCLSLW